MATGMERTDRCELLARLSDTELAELVQLIDAGTLDDLALVVEPTVGMIMARVVEGARGETFNFGEVLVTECQVRVGDQEGWSMLLGRRPEGALAAATLDAALAAGCDPEERIDRQIAQLIAVQDAELAAQRAELAATRVHFETQ